MSKLLLILACIGSALGLSTMNKSFAQGTDTLVLGFIEEPPFIVEQDSSYVGLSIDLIEKVGEHLNVQLQYKPYADIDQLIDGIQKNKYDLCINPAAPNLELLDEVDFTQPFMVSNLAIAFKSEERHVLYKLLNSIFSWRFLSGLVMVGFIILLFGSLTWLFERKKNVNHFPNTRKGVWEAFWWSAVTMTTVGYGDKAPRTTGGRIVAITWMFTALIIISSYTGSVASLLTVNELTLDIKSLNDLRKSKIVVIGNNTAEQFLRLSNIPFKRVDTTEEGMKLVMANKADALLHDESSIKHLISTQGLEEFIAIAPAKYSNKFYGFTMPRNHPHYDAVNAAVLTVTNSIEWRLQMGAYSIE